MFPAQRHPPGLFSSDADNAERRTRILQYAQEVVDEIWMYREWPFTLSSTAGTVTISSGTAGDLPADFLELGQQGGVYDSNGWLMTEVSPQLLIESRNASVGSIGMQQVYAIFGYNAATQRKMLQTLGTGTFTVYYRANPPTLVDADSTSGLLHYIPIGYHNTVILPGVAAKAKRSLGDPGWVVEDQKYQNGLGYMVHRERSRKPSIRRMAFATVMR